MYVASYPATNSILEQTNALYNAAWVVSDSYIASYLFPYFLYHNPTSLFKYKIFNSCIYITKNCSNTAIMTFIAVYSLFICVSKC